MLQRRDIIVFVCGAVAVLVGELQEILRLVEAVPVDSMSIREDS